jgi:hypothetical protein
VLLEDAQIGHPIANEPKPTNLAAYQKTWFGIDSFTKANFSLWL